MTRRVGLASVQPWMMAVTVALAMVLAWAFALGSPDFPMDDAYIVQHAVAGLHDGVDARYGGSPLRGITSPLHVLLIWCLSLAMPVPWAQFVVAGGAFVMWVAGTVELARREGVPRHGQCLLAGLSMLGGMIFYQAFNGLETGLAMAVGAWALTLFLDPAQVRPWHAVMLGILPFVRPELGLLSALLLLRHGVLGADGWRSMWMRGRAMLPGCVAGALLPLAFIWWRGEGVLPNTVMAKAYFFAEGCMPWDLRLARWWAALRFFSMEFGLGWPCVGLLGLLVSRLRWVLLPYVAIFLWVYLDRLPGALFHNWHRYVYVLLPALMAGWVALLTLPIRRMRFPFVSALVVAVLACALLFWTGVLRLQGGVDFTRRELAGVSQWVASHVPERATILVHDAGHVSLVGRQHLVDVVGLKTPSSARVHADYTWAQCSPRTSALGVIAQRSGAGYFVVFGEWDQVFHLTDNLRDAGWDVLRVDAERGDTAYRVYRIQPRH